MKTLPKFNLRPTKRQLSLCRNHGKEDFSADADDRFFFEEDNIPSVPEFVRTEPGSLIKMRGSVEPHVDNDLDQDPREGQKGTIFWVLSARDIHTNIIRTPVLKVDGYEALRMYPGDWVFFNHHLEHCVVFNNTWMGVAWQVKKIRTRKKRNDS